MAEMGQPGPRSRPRRGPPPTPLGDGAADTGKRYGGEAPHAHLRAHAKARSDRTVRRLAEAIQSLKGQGESVSLPAIKRIGGPDAKTILRNPEARALFEANSTHHQAKREREKAERRRHRRRKVGAGGGSDGAPDPRTSVPPARDPLLDRSKAQLVALLREATVERDAARGERDEMRRRYAALLQEHMGCAQTIMKKEAELARFETFLRTFRARMEGQESR